MNTLPQNFRNIAVIGASAGGLEVLLEVVQGIPADIPLAIFVVQHIPPYAKSNLDRILAGHTALRCKKAEDGEEVRPGTVYVARADRHMLLEADRVVVSKGPRENRFRPAVDALFRSAATAYRERVVGVVLSGALNDGTSGMWSIKRYGGTAIVQDPGEAMFPDMPRGVMEYTDVDHVLPARKIGAKLAELATSRIVTHHQKPAGMEHLDLHQLEIEIAKGKNGVTRGILERGRPSSLACPECHGALTQFEEGNLIRFRCHTGHAHTADSLLASLRDNVEKSMWEVMRGMEESRLLLDRMAQQMEGAGQTETAAEFTAQARELQRQAIDVQRVIERTDLSADRAPVAEFIK